MALNIDPKEMDRAWNDRNNSEKFYKYLYDIAALQVARKGIRIQDQADFVQFCIMKCYKHQESYKPNKGSTYSFFWKQISLAIAYKLRKQARRDNKIKTFYVEQEKILDWAERQQINDDGISLVENIEESEARLVKEAFKKYNKAHPENKLKPNKENAKTVIKWIKKTDPNFIERFDILKPIFNSWASTV